MEPADARALQTMMKSVLGDAAQLADYDTVKNRMKSSRLHHGLPEWRQVDMAVRHVRHHDRAPLPARC